MNANPTNTSSQIARMAISILVGHGVKRIIISPGSRNTPMIIAASRNRGIECISVVDERSAAFIALGLGVISDEPVALCCTSGTALLNYAPALAEAYYRHIPLIVLSADRPMEWIDQDDSQTIHQAGALSNYVKQSYDIPAGDTETNLWFANRVLNDAMLTAMNGYKAPVHINIQFSEPLGSLTANIPEKFRIIDMQSQRTDIPETVVRELGKEIASPKKVLIVAGFHMPDKTLNAALAQMARLPNVVVMTESIANLHSPDFINRIDSTLSVIDDKTRNEMAPDCVMTLGGAIVSRQIKQYLRNMPPAIHWHIGHTHTTVDCFKSVTRRIDVDPGIFFRQLASEMQCCRAECDYARRWMIMKDKAIATHNAYIARSPWSDLKAMAIVADLVPNGWNIQYSNGTSIRYGQLFADGHQHRCDCNRGVSGIDGCTSTAIGASMAYKSHPTLLISGDMSARYDVGAFGCNIIPSRFKMIILNNGGGDIFRFIASTKHLEEREDMLCLPIKESPFAHIAKAYGLRYLSAGDEKELRQVFAEFSDIADRPAILEIFTPREKNAEVLTGYFSREKFLQRI